jgi:hypothetical protein
VLPDEKGDYLPEDEQKQKPDCAHEKGAHFAAERETFFI